MFNTSVIEPHQVKKWRSDGVERKRERESPFYNIFVTASKSTYILDRYFLNYKFSFSVSVRCNSDIFIQLRQACKNYDQTERCMIELYII